MLLSALVNVSGSNSKSILHFNVEIPFFVAFSKRHRETSVFCSRFSTVMDRWDRASLFYLELLVISAHVSDRKN
jgi:hypothetical protein